MGLPDTLLNFQDRPPYQHWRKWSSQGSACKASSGPHARKATARRSGWALTRHYRSIFQMLSLSTRLSCEDKQVGSIIHITISFAFREN